MAEEVIVKSKELFYRGKSVDFLKSLDVRECAKYLPSRSRRSVLRNFQSIEQFIKRCEDKISKNKKIKTHLRDIVVVPKLVGMTIGIYNGKTFNDANITHNMIGHRLGEFSLTRQKVSHGSPGIGSTKSSAAKKK
ncbi:MAG TPA: ribosomal protein S19 family protein [Candidatus Nanoarchaeia archaeon]|nr:ribosomal protein S19 family protein [Candidatus Nanoarchaeia archaeon]